MGDPALRAIPTPDLPSAVGVELARVRGLAPGAPLGVSLADTAAWLLAYCLALSSQVPTQAPGGYDVFVIPDGLFSGALQDGVVSGCSYYDLLRIGFASSYISLRVLEGVLGYQELQAAGLVPSTCPSATSSVGVDNAHALTGGRVPCYSSADVAGIAATVRAAIGNRFGDPGPAPGAWLDWLGCPGLSPSLGASNVTACGLQEVHNGTVPHGVPLTPVATGFLPTAALAAKLGVPLGGAVARTDAVLAAARDAAVVTYVRVLETFLWGGVGKGGEGWSAVVCSCGSW